jgi:hypothetical protein
MLSFSSFGQRKTTYVKSYFRKDGTFVRSHTRHYNSGSNTSGSSASGGNTSGSSYSQHSTSRESEELEVFEGDFRIVPSGRTGGYKKIEGMKVYPTTLVADTNGVTVLLAVLRYNDSVIVDICPLEKSIVTYDYKTYSTLLYFKINKDKLKPEQVIELVSKYGFDLRDDYLTKSVYMGTGKAELPKYMNLKIEAITLK